MSAVRTESAISGARVAVLASTCLALGAVGAAVVCSLHGAAPSEPRACVDRAARDQIAELRRMSLEAMARTAQLVSAAERTSVPETAPAPAPASLRQAAPVRDPGPRRYSHFEIANAAVRVAQKPDGTYDVQTTDPALAGSLVRVVAATEAGDEDELIVRIPD